MLDTIKHALEAAGATVARAKDFGALVIAEVEHPTRIGPFFLWITEAPEGDDDTVGTLLLLGQALSLEDLAARSLDTIAWDSRMNRLRVWLGLNGD